jgi:hypothetical protein
LRELKVGIPVGWPEYAGNIRGAPFDAQSTITSVNSSEMKRMKWKERVKEARGYAK